MRNLKAAAPVTRRQCLAFMASAATLGVSTFARAQAWPDKPIRLFLGYPPGGGVDFIGRLIANRISPILGQQVVVQNVPGATGAIALERVATSAPDGYSLVMITAADTILPSLRAKLPFDVKRDLAPVSPVVTSALVMVVNPQLPVRNVRELIAYAQARPGVLNYGSPGVGNSQHLAGESFNQMAKTNIVHVPFKGVVEAMTATVGGEIHVLYPSITPTLPLIESGKLRMLAVTSKTRSAALPQVPTISEAGLPGYDRATWFGIAAPAGTPRDVVAKINAAITTGMQGADRDALLKQGLEVWTQPADQFTAFVHGELAGNAALVQSVGIKPE